MQISKMVSTCKNTKGSDNIAKLLDSVEDKKDLWLMYEVCKGRSLND